MVRFATDISPAYGPEAPPAALGGPLEAPRPGDSDGPAAAEAREFASWLPVLAPVVARPGPLHPATARLFVLSVRAVDRLSAGQLARRYRLKERAVRSWWTERRVPSTRRTLAEIQAHAREVCRRLGIPMHQPAVRSSAEWPHSFTRTSSAGLLELALRGYESKPDSLPINRALVLLTAGAIWPRVRGRIESDDRDGMLVEARRAIARVLWERGWTQRAIGECVSRSTSDVNHLLNDVGLHFD